MAENNLNGSACTTIEAYKEWKHLPEERRRLYLQNAFCPACSKSGPVSFASGYTISKDPMGLIIEGKCAKCGRPIARCVFEAL